MGTLGVITGLSSEAECFASLAGHGGVVVRTSGADAARAAAQARQLVDEGCRALLSFGMAGALSPALAAGDVVVAESVAGPGGARYETTAGWRNDLLRHLATVDKGAPRLAAVTVGIVAGVDKPVSTPARKRYLYQQTAAEAVDMESHAVAAVADEAGVPFLVVRAVADTAHRRIPAWVMRGIAPDGDIRLAPIVLGLMLRPWDVPGLIGLAADNEKALDSLRRVALRAGAGFGLVL